MPFEPGARTSDMDTDTRILDLHDGLKYLENKGLLTVMKKIGLNGFVARNPKFEWTEVVLASKVETVTTDNSQTDVDVGDAYTYQIGDILAIEDERLRVTAIVDANTITVERGLGATSAAAHTAKELRNLGSAQPENTTGPDPQSDTGTRLYNLIQIKDKSVEVSNSEIMSMRTEGNPLRGQLKRRFIEYWRELANAFLYNKRETLTVSGKEVRVFGGLNFYLSTHVVAAAGADVSVALVDGLIKDILQSGGDPKAILVHPTQKQMIDALDVNAVRVGKEERKAGSQRSHTWQSSVLDRDLPIIQDSTIKQDELYVIDWDTIKGGYQAGNGKDGRIGVVDATLPGQDGVKRVIRGHVSYKFETEAGNGVIRGLATS